MTKNQLDDLKLFIEQRTGLPQSLLTGETAEELTAQTRALLALKREQQKPRTTAEQFGAWFSAQLGEDAPQDTGALADVDEAARLAAGKYPSVSDAGTVPSGDDRPPAEKFAEWMHKQLDFDPFTDADGWKRFG